MQRRDVFKLAAGAAMLTFPHIARAQRPRTLKYVPGVGLTLLDPVWTTARGAHLHGHLVFDTLYGLDQTSDRTPPNARRAHCREQWHDLDVAAA